MSKEERKGELLRVPATSEVLESSSWAGQQTGVLGEKGDIQFRKCGNEKTENQRVAKEFQKGLFSFQKEKKGSILQ